MESSRGVSTLHRDAALVRLGSDLYEPPIWGFLEGGERRTDQLHQAMVLYHQPDCSACRLLTVEPNRLSYQSSDLPVREKRWALELSDEQLQVRTATMKVSSETNTVRDCAAPTLT